MLLPVEKALWYVESHFRQEVRLSELAPRCGVSVSYLSRTFALALGCSFQAYLRGRRLSEAARRLAAGEPNILDLALEFGYGSHEAFTRAFRDQFGQTPESVRAQGHVDNLRLWEAIRMNDSEWKDIQPASFQKLEAMTVAGLRRHYQGSQQGAGIPAQWQQFAPYLGQLPQQVGREAYGVCCDFREDGSFDYLCGVQVSQSGDLPAEWSTVALPAGQTWAVFRHDGHISSVRHTFHSIWSLWLPQSAYQAAEAPVFERYGPEFDGQTGMGGLEIWVPVAKGE